MRDRRLRQAGSRDNIARAHGAVRRELAHDRQTGRIGERTEQPDVGILRTCHANILSIDFYIDNIRYMSYCAPIDTTLQPRHPAMDRSTEILFDAIRTERALEETPARQEHRRLAQLAAGIARCCRVSWARRLLAALNRPASSVEGRIR